METLLGIILLLLLGSCATQMTSLDKTPSKPMVKAYDQDGHYFMADSSVAARVKFWHDSLREHPPTPKPCTFCGDPSDTTKGAK